jgi:CheY-like chemotaxis protein
MEQQEAPPPQEAPAPVLHVLLVDPMAGHAALARDMLLAQGHRVTVVHDWRHAETMLTLHAIEAVVMAIATPGARRRSAAQLMRASTARWAALPLVGLAPGADRREGETARAAGFDTLVSRPFGAEALDAGLREAVRLRTPPLLVDAALRAALRQTHGPAALAARDEAAVGQVARILAPLMDGTPAEAELLAAVTAVAETMEGIGAAHVALLARGIGAAGPRGARSIHPLLQVVASTRFALRHDRMHAARLDPIWAASDTPPGDTP